MCPCPDAAFDPAWTEQLVEVLYKGRDTSGRGDPRPWYREIAANLVPQMAVFPPERASEADDALERLIAFAHDRPFEPAAKQAFANLLAQPGRMESLARGLRSKAGDHREDKRFAPDPTELRSVIADLAADPIARQTLLSAAGDYARDELASSGPAVGRKGCRPCRPGGVEPHWGPLRRHRLEVLRHSIGPRSREGRAGYRQRRPRERRRLARCAGAEKVPLVSLAVDTGKTIVFASGSEELARRDRLEELRRAKTDQERREKFIRSLGGTLEHLAYVSVLTDPGTWSRLHVNLDPRNFPPDLPADPVFRDGRIEEVSQWREALFPNGVLQVPHPSDAHKWDLFVTWVRYTNPELANAADGIRDQMQEELPRADLGFAVNVPRRLRSAAVPLMVAVATLSAGEPMPRPQAKPGEIVVVVEAGKGDWFTAMTVSRDGEVFVAERGIGDEEVLGVRPERAAARRVPG